MKKYFGILWLMIWSLLLVLTSCGTGLDSVNNQINALQSPVVVVSTGEHGNVHAVCLRDGKGEVLILTGYIALRGLQKGDTIK